MTQNGENENNLANKSSSCFQVPLWSVEDVTSWVKQIGFASDCFLEAGVDGDLLLQLDENNLRADLGIDNGILRKRFLRELASLKRNADYSSMDSNDIAGFLSSRVGTEYRAYAYPLLTKDLGLELMQRLNEGDLNDMLQEAGVTSAIHRHRIAEAVLKEAEDDEVSHHLHPGSRTSSGSSLASSAHPPHNVDVYVTYPRQHHGGAELASLVKMHLQLRGLSVYSASDSADSNIDNALRYVKEAKNFVIVLPAHGLDDVIGDIAGKNMLHREVVAALQSGCNIVPVIDGFQFPEPEELPEDVRALCYFNGVRWVHDYQEACVDKLERFIRGEPFFRVDSAGRLGHGSYRVSRADSGRSTPLSRIPTPTPLFGNRNQRNRTISVDSAISSACY
jgi:hypothetical protein